MFWGSCWGGFGIVLGWFGDELGLAWGDFSMMFGCFGNLLGVFICFILCCFMSFHVIICLCCFYFVGVSWGIVRGIFCGNMGPLGPVLMPLVCYWDFVFLGVTLVSWVKNLISMSIRLNPFVLTPFVLRGRATFQRRRAQASKP